jgi:recombination protein RecT
MTTAVATIPAEKPGDIIRAQLDRLTPDLLSSLPNGMSVERFKTVVILAVSKNPDLMACTPASIILAVTEAAQLGLEPTGSLSQAWLIPYNENIARKGERPNYIKKAQLQIGVRGLEELARRSGRVSHITSRVVYEGDQFEVLYGHDERIVHVPAFGEMTVERITHVYAIANMLDGTHPFDVMTKAQVDAIRARSKAANFGPWVSDYPEMARKTAVRRLVKTLPLTIEVREAIESDDEREFGLGSAPVPVNAGTARVRALLADRGILPASEPLPPTDAPGASESVTTPNDGATGASAAGQPETDGLAAESSGVAVCADTSDPDLGPVETCIDAPGHKGKVHKAASGSTWPVTP